MVCLLVLVTLTAGCRSEENPLAGTRWRLIELTRDGQAMPIPDDLMPVLTFGEEYAVFHAGCTGGVGSAYDFGVLPEAVAVIRPIYCLNDRVESWDLEVAFAEFTSEAESHELIGDELILYSPTGVMRFRRMSAAEESAVATVTAAAYTPRPPTPAPLTPTPARPKGETDPLTTAILDGLDADAETLREFMQSEEARRALFGGVYLDHPDALSPGAPGSVVVLQLVVEDENEMADLRAQLPVLNYPDRLRVEQVACTHDHLASRLDGVMAAAIEEGVYVSHGIDKAKNRAFLMIRVIPEWLTPEGDVDKEALPFYLSSEVLDPCVFVGVGGGNLGQTPDPLEGTAWLLTAVPGEDDALARLPTDKRPILYFDFGELLFDTGCNDPNAAYVMDGASLTITIVRATTMDCFSRLGHNGMAVERALADALGSIDSYTIDGNTLRLHYAGGDLVFRRLPD